MENQIKKQLADIEQRHDVRILYACESGSRAWGFPSPDSDYDVRFIYVHPKNWYLELQKKSDSLEFPISDLLDFGGWDLKKALLLSTKSNAPLIEWVQSPIVYLDSSDFEDLLKDAVLSHFSPIRTMHHYLSMSNKYIESCKNQQDLKLKKLFYTIRSVISGMWIRETSHAPTMFMPDMFSVVDAVYLDQIWELIRLKLSCNEDYIHTDEPELFAYLKKQHKLNAACATALNANTIDYIKLNNLFLRSL